MSELTLTSQTSPVQPKKENLNNHPPATNRGVENPLHEKIDWISFTIKDLQAEVWPNELDKTYTPTKSFNGYDTAWQFEDGRVQLFHTARPEMGIHCVVSGQACSNLQLHIPKIIRNCWEKGGHITRFDIALDDYLGAISPRRANQELREERVICRAKQTPFYSDPRQPGETQYFGKFSSEVMLRIYDKDAEQGIYGFRTRTEIVFKGKRADKAAHAYISGSSGGELVLGFIQFPEWREWNEAFVLPAIKVPAEKTESKRIAWLLGTCAKSLAIEVSEKGGDLEIVDRFLQAFRDHLSDIRQREE